MMTLFALSGVLICTASALAQSDKTLTVAADGSGDHSTVQAAVDAVPENNSERIVIHIKPGTYKERITLPATKPFVTFQGEDARTTILTYDWNARHIGPEGREVGTGGSYSTKISGHDFIAEDLTFENSAGDTGQALALFVDGDRIIFRNCRLLGWQDTLYTGRGRQYYDHCWIEGRTDFIFGGATVVFDRCTIHSKNGGFVTAASTPPESPFGYVFLDCKLTGDPTPWSNPNPSAVTARWTDPNPKADLGRPWRPYAAVAYIRCELGDHIRPEGWNNWGNPENEKTARYVEYRCTGPGADRSKRVAWSRELTDEEASKYTVPNILGGSDGWDPTK